MGTADRVLSLIACPCFFFFFCICSSVPLFLFPPAHRVRVRIRTWGHAIFSPCLPLLLICYAETLLCFYSSGGIRIPSLAAGLGALGAFIALILTAILIIKLKLRKLDRDRAKEDATHTVGLVVVGLTMDMAREPPSTSLTVPVPTAEEQGPPPLVTTTSEDEDSKHPFPVGPDKDGNFGMEIIDLYVCPSLLILLMLYIL